MRRGEEEEEIRRGRGLEGWNINKYM